VIVGAKRMERTLCVFNRDRESFLGFRVTRADTTLTRLKGLLGSIRLNADGGLWLIPSRGIHTIGMLFAIDVIYLDAANRVIHLIEHLGSFRISPIRIKSASILELPLRAIYSSHTRIGDQLVICAPEEIGQFCGGRQELPFQTQPEDCAISRREKGAESQGE
jgi:uncharacterized membrane protein (UPF0127 family)